jgi:predicted ester cyclase
MGIAPTGKQWTNSGVGFLTFIEGRIAEIVWFFDVFNHISQLGATFTTT